jgi:hypothetical protein
MDPDIEVLAKMWFGTDPPVGIVIIKNKDGNTRAYIKPVTGNNEDDDVKSIVDWGQKFPPAIARLLQIYINGRKLTDPQNEFELMEAGAVANLFDISKMIKKDTTNEELGKEIRDFVETLKENDVDSLLIG